MMNANSVVENIVSSVKKSNLNYFIQETPFSLIINFRKSFIKNKNGSTISPPDSIMQNSSKVNEASEELKRKVINLESENSSLKEALGQLQIELQGAHNALHEQGIQFEKAKDANEKLRDENLTLKRANSELKAANEAILSDKNTRKT